MLVQTGQFHCAVLCTGECQTQVRFVAFILHTVDEHDTLVRTYGSAYFPGIFQYADQLTGLLKLGHKLAFAADLLEACRGLLIDSREITRFQLGKNVNSSGLRINFILGGYGWRGALVFGRHGRGSLFLRGSRRCDRRILA